MATHEDLKTAAWLVWRPYSPQINEERKRIGMTPKASTDPDYMGLYPSMEAAEVEIEVLRQKTGVEWYATCLPLIGWGVTQWADNRPDNITGE